MEYKLEAVRLARGGQACAVTAKMLGIPKRTLENWVHQSAKGKLTDAGEKQVSPEQMELARLRAELARVKMERDILKKRRRTLCVLDLHSRQLVGWSMRPHIQTSLVTDALRMAWFRRRPEPGLVSRPDRGSQYCSRAFQGALAEYGMQSSMSRKGNWWENEVSVKANTRSALCRNYNAPMENLWGSLKVGRLYGMRFEARRQAMGEVVDWLTYYNHKRLHSTLCYISPMQFEKNWFAAQLKDAA